MAILIDLHEHISQHQKELGKWFQSHGMKSKPPIYASVDIRNSGYKVSAIDTNLFPAGYNNIYPRDLQVASAFLRPFLEKRYGKIKRVLLLPEDHTRNQPYLQNLSSLQHMFEHAEFEMRIATLNPEMRKDRVELEIGEDRPLEIYRAVKNGNRLGAGDFDPDIILVNNDFSLAPPEQILGLDQPIEPPLRGGWFSRRKSHHFEILHRLIDEFCEVIQIEPWLMKAHTEVVSKIDVNDAADRQRLADVAGRMIERIKKDYENRGVKNDPYVFLKDNSGTYGIAVMAVKTQQEVLEMNAKTRRKMSSGKGRSTVTEILVQEGVPTNIMVGDCPAEPVIYLAAGEVIGGFFRKHCEQDELGSLNVKGMLFSLLTFSSPLDTNIPESAQRDDLSLQVYGTLAKVAYLAVGYELQELES